MLMYNVFILCLLSVIQSLVIDSQRGGQRSQNSLIRLENKPTNTAVLGGVCCVCVSAGVKVSTASHMFKCLMRLDLKACVFVQHSLFV